MTPPSENHSSHELTSSTDFNNVSRVCERRMGETELSYYLPSRASGTSDMFLHLSFRAPAHIMERARVRAAWALLRLRHPLMGATVRMETYDDVRLLYQRPESAECLLKDAERTVEFRYESEYQLIDSYLNGTRTLSDDRLSYLFVLTPPSSTGVDTPTSIPDHASAFEEQSDLCNEYTILICATHFIGDGIAIHMFGNEFFTTISSDLSTEDIEKTLDMEWEIKHSSMNTIKDVLPVPLEARLPPIEGKFRKAACKVDFKNSEDKLIGGHAIPRKKATSAHSVFINVPFDEKRTRQILQTCKSNGVSVSNALFAICDIAWAKMTTPNPELPILLYSAMNLRPYFTPSKENQSYWFLSIGYFNVILPIFPPANPSDLASTFWCRAKAAKAQSIKAAKHPMLVPRAHFKARARGQQARFWAKVDDDEAAKLANGTAVPHVLQPPFPKPISAATEAKPRAPSTALLGLSMLGNLDGIYKSSSSQGRIQLHTITGGTRQRSNAILLYAYTFASKLWLSLQFDENGLDKDVVEKYWSEVLKCVEEFLMK
ncbi:hypothetical protein BD410DRAFT_896234 [Rickenella mellea]|uniref:CoA-dependent acyltransferase n=1 Tax=Rickenella mellea TaxID=50990 RepID=A0A4Y7QDJ4_9AGAM|nr:hypothetical protein BD410DRAFT_896234 [Rickenella mellea]